MSQNSDETVRSSRDLTDPLVDRDCVLLDGDCKCYRPKSDCKYLNKEVFFSKKGRVLTKEEKIRVLNRQRMQYLKKSQAYSGKLSKVVELIEEIEATK